MDTLYIIYRNKWSITRTSLVMKHQYKDIQRGVKDLLFQKLAFNSTFTFYDIASITKAKCRFSLQLLFILWSIIGLLWQRLLIKNTKYILHGND